MYNIWVIFSCYLKNNSAFKNGQRRAVHLINFHKFLVEIQICIVTIGGVFIIVAGVGECEPMSPIDIQ